MSFLRQFGDAKECTPEWEKKQVVENIIGLLAKSPEPDSKVIWCCDKPCPLERLPELYKEYVSRWNVSNDLMSCINKLGYSDLRAILSEFDFFKVSENGLIYSPKAEDVMVECYYRQHKFSVCLLDIEPSLYWNKCPVCGQVNDDERVKYSIICSVTAELLCKWCSYFHRESINISDREVHNHVNRNCSACPYVDCPYSWDVASNNNDCDSKRKPGMISFLLPQDAMSLYANIPNMRKFLDELASNAEEEFWGMNLGYLRAYISITFYFQLIRRSQGAGLIETIHYSWFNTGLQHRIKQASIFMCFKPTPRGWEYEALTWDGAANGLYDKYRGDKGLIPEYIPPYESVNELFWDVKLDINWKENFDHMYFDNLGRIITSKSFQNNLSGIAVPEKYKRQVEVKYDKIKIAKDQQSIEEEKKTQFYRDLKDLFEYSIKRSIERVRYNYKWILPIYYPRNRSMSLALPLFLSRKGKMKEPDLALLCTRRKNSGTEYYDARTILQKHMIYQDAREVCKPIVDWVSGLLHDDYVGRVTSIVNGVGEIKSDSGMPLRFYMSENPSVRGLLSEGDRVKFEFESRGQIYVAVNVRLLQKQDTGYAGRQKAKKKLHRHWWDTRW